MPSTGHHLSLKHRLLISAVISAAAIIVISLIGLIGVQNVTQSTSVAIRADYANTTAITQVRGTISSLDRDFRQAVIETDPTWIQQAHALEKSDETDLIAALAVYNALPQSGNAAAAAAKLNGDISVWLATLHTMEQYAGLNTPQGDATVLVILHSQWLPQSQSLNQSIQNIILSDQQRGQTVLAAASASTRWLVTIEIGVGLVALFLALGFLTLTNRRINSGIATLSLSVTTMTAGDLELTTAMRTLATTGDEFGLLAQHFIQLGSVFGQIITQVQAASANINLMMDQIGLAARQSGGAVEQVAQSSQVVAADAQAQNEDLSQSTESLDTLSQRGSSIQERAVAMMQTMEVLKESVAHTADRIRALGDRSQTIGRIVQTINEIAEQTNLLALNAAIEAARAGDHGRGFAVVADEVRKLAERSATATKEIGVIVGETVTETTEAVTAMRLGSQQVEEGVARVREVERAAVEMSESLRDVSMRMGTVAEVSQRNTAAAEELSAAAEEMSAQVEETIAATNSLANLAQDLRKSLGVFAPEDTESTTINFTAAQARRRVA